MKSKTKSNAADGQQVAVRKARQRELKGTPIVVAFARRLRRWRREQKKSVRQVAKDLGVSAAIVSEWENCNRFPSVMTLQAIINYTGIPACILVQSQDDAEMSTPFAKAKSRITNPR